MPQPWQLPGPLTSLEQLIAPSKQTKVGQSVSSDGAAFAAAADVGALARSHGPFDAVVDCSGLGAGALVGDSKVYPIRGQIMRVRAPWVTHHYSDHDGFYIIPNRNSVVLGGTAQV